MTKARKTYVRRNWSSGYPTAVRAEGVYVYDEEGKRYIDASGGSSSVVNIGHGNKEAVDAWYKQARDVAFSPAHAFTNRPAEDLADMIVSLAPGNLRDNARVWFSCSGTDATDDAVRLARQYRVVRGEHSRHIVIGRWESFHGNAISVAGYSGHSYRRNVYQTMFINAPHIYPAYCYRCPFEKTYPSCDLLCARFLEKEILHQGPEHVLAFIAEPVVGAALGCVPAPDGYFQIIREICDKYGVLFITDEVMTGLGRTGKMWAIEHWGVAPDIMATGKGIGSGYTPIAAMVAREDIWLALEQAGAPFRAGHTYNANPASCATSKAVVTYMLEHKLPEQAAKHGDYFLQQLATLLSHPIVGDVRGKGLLIGFELVKDKATKEPFPASLRMSSRLETEALKRGLVIYACTGSVDGAAGDMILLSPPLIITPAQIDECMRTLHESLSALAQEVLTISMA